MAVSRAQLLRRSLGVWRRAEREPAHPLRVASDALTRPEAERLGAAVTDELVKRRVPGAQVAVRRAGRLHWSACYGRLDGSRAVAEPDRFVIASATKLATATVCARLAEQGALGLDDPVAQWLPELPHADVLTPRLLLSHRSGLREYARDPALRRRLGGGEPAYPWTRAEVIAAIARQTPERAPGKRFAYRNSNFIVAAELAERAGGADFEELLQTHIARPLGLTGFSSATAVDGTRLAGPHATMLGRPIDLLALTGGQIPTDAIGPVWGDGGIACSARELARFTEALFGAEIVSERTRDAMVKRRSRMGPKTGYGLGVILSPAPAGRMVGHNGLYYGWTSFTGIDAATATTIAVVTNLGAMSLPATRVAATARTALARC